MKAPQKGLLHTLSRLLKGQSLLRIRMNESFLSKTISGKVLDVGGGRNPDYFAYFTKEGEVHIEAVDGSLTGINFEEDRLPYEDASIDTVIVSNTLEHVYNYRHLLLEVRRVLKPGGRLIGFVPFWIAYHPDPHDYFRYTREALIKMLDDAQFSRVEVEAVGSGPFLANFNTIVLSMPRILRPVLFLIYAPLDALFVWLRPLAKKRTPLGFTLSAQ